MNKKQLEQMNLALNYLRMGNRGHLNCIRLTNNNLRTKHTEEMISRCLEYLENQIPFVTEAIFANGTRADILLPSTFEVVELLHSETEERFKEKIKNYPSAFNIRRVKV